LAVTAVLIYHLNAGWLPGGFLGVDVFFVLSGFLITSLLAVEWVSTGTVRVGRFYVRRARRLLPALITMLLTVVFVTAAVAPSELRRLRGDVAGALTYSTNWTQIVWHRSYSAAGPTSLPQHLWSLAVEEQFYLLWPLCSRPVPSHGRSAPGAAGHACRHRHIGGRDGMAVPVVPGSRPRVLRQ
jgi:peptidoglycan/LPS O-acetylase OafA/YrhL